MNNPIYLYDPGYPTAVRRCLGFHDTLDRGSPGGARPRFPWVGTTERPGLPNRGATLPGVP